MVQVQPLPKKPLVPVPVLQETPVPHVLAHSCLGAVEGDMRPPKLSREEGVCDCPGGKKVITPKLPRCVSAPLVSSTTPFYLESLDWARHPK